MKTQVWMVAKKFHGFPKAENFSLQQEELPSLKEGQFISESVCWSVDPYNRAFDPPAGQPHIGYQVGKIIQSQHADYPVGKHVVGHFGWRIHTLSDPQKDTQIYLVPDDLAGLPLSSSIGILGMPGFTSYLGLETLEPKSGDTLVVTSAAGAVGNVVGQLAKLKGCTVIGYTGSDEKVSWLTEELKFDHAYNYKTCNLADTLSEAAPNGVDCFFDNVGGHIANIVYEQMNQGGRVCQCGGISNYNLVGKEKQHANTQVLKKKGVKIESFAIFSLRERWMTDALPILVHLMKEGKLKYREYP